MIEVGRALKEQDGANAIVMGCAGMARHRKPLEDALGIPVIDPTQAAVTMAIGAVQLALRHRCSLMPAKRASSALHRAGARLRRGRA